MEQEAKKKEEVSIIISYCVLQHFTQILHGNEVEISALEKHKNKLATDVEKVHTELQQEKKVRAEISVSNQATLYMLRIPVKMTA